MSLANLAAGAEIRAALCPVCLSVYALRGDGGEDLPMRSPPVCGNHRGFGVRAIGFPTRALAEEARSLVARAA